jgi:hypothetical protein
MKEVLKLWCVYQQLFIEAFQLDIDTVVFIVGGALNLVSHLCLGWEEISRKP